MDCKKIGEYIQLKRKKIGLTQSQLSEKLGITSKAVSKWECGVALPDIALFPELTKILNITIEELLNGEDNKEIPIDKKKNYIIIILSSLIFLLIVLSIGLIIYFNNNYSKVSIYDIESAEETFYVDGNIMTIDGQSYLSITKVDYLGNDIDLFSNVYDFEYEIYYDEELLYKSSEIDAEIFKLETLKEGFELIKILNVVKFDCSIYDESFYLNLNMRFVDDCGLEQKFNVVLKVI